MLGQFLTTLYCHGCGKDPSATQSSSWSKALRGTGGVAGTWLGEWSGRVCRSVDEPGKPEQRRIRGEQCRSQEVKQGSAGKHWMLE